MIIPALTLLASSLMVAAAPPLRLVEPKKAFVAPMFHPPLAAGRTAPARLRQEPLPTSAPNPSFKCHIGVIKADPEIDSGMVVEAPAIDPSIVRRSGCAEPSKD